MYIFPNQNNNIDANIQKNRLYIISLIKTIIYMWKIIKK